MWEIFKTEQEEMWILETKNELNNLNNRYEQMFRKKKTNEMELKLHYFYLIFLLTFLIFELLIFFLLNFILTP